MSEQDSPVVQADKSDAKENLKTWLNQALLAYKMGKTDAPGYEAHMGILMIDPTTKAGRVAATFDHVEEFFLAIGELVGEDMKAHPFSPTFDPATLTEENDK